MMSPAVCTAGTIKTITVKKQTRSGERVCVNDAILQCFFTQLQFYRELSLLLFGRFPDSRIFVTTLPSHAEAQWFATPFLPAYGDRIVRALHPIPS
jgi:hypothetical protein